MFTNFTKYVLIGALLLIVLVGPTFAQEPAQELAYLTTYNIEGLELDPLWRDAGTVRLIMISDMAYLNTYNIAGLTNDPLWSGDVGHVQIVVNADGS